MAHENLAQALAAFQAEVPKMSKDETAKVKSEKANYTYGYAGLDQFVEIVEPVLGKHGLSVTSSTGFTEQGRFMLTVTLLHQSGESREAVWPLPDPTRVGPQDIGSALTYGRRYLGWALTGTFPGGIDDDGAQAQQAPRDSWANAKPVSAPPAQQPKTSWTDEEVIGYVQKMPTAPMDKALAAYDWMAGKNLHNREVPLDHVDGVVRVTATALIACRIADEALLDTMDVKGIKGLELLANNRGLLKVQVSTTENLAEALYSARELAAHAAGAPSSPIESDSDIRAES